MSLDEIFYFMQGSMDKLPIPYNSGLLNTLPLGICPCRTSSAVKWHQFSQKLRSTVSMTLFRDKLFPEIVSRQLFQDDAYRSARDKISDVNTLGASAVIGITSALA